MSLYYVNSQINAVRSSISVENAKIAEKQEEIRRLIQAKSDLFDIQGEFQLNEYRIKEPVFTTTTWHGSLATEFNSFRDQEVTSGYRLLYQSQLDDVLSGIDAKINELNQEIENLEITVASYERRLEDLYDLRNEIKEREANN